jgi:hypothetical protein
MLRFDPDAPPHWLSLIVSFLCALIIYDGQQIVNQSKPATVGWRMARIAQ